MILTNKEIQVKNIIFEDTVNYKKVSMTLIFPHCNMKCNQEEGQEVCQNRQLLNEPDIVTNINRIIESYINNPITHAVVMQGLEPFDDYSQLKTFIGILRNEYRCSDDVVIYTGYTEEEIQDQIYELKKQFQNIIIKFGRYKPNQESHYDELLGVKLASDNQYAKKIS